MPLSIDGLGNFTEFEGVPAEAPKSFEIVYLEPENLRFRYDGDTLTMRNVQDGTFYPRITLRRCFPLSEGELFLLVRRPVKDDDIEIGVVQGVSRLDSESQKAVDRELRLHYFVPRVKSILSIREEFGFLYWNVETDRGNKEFIMRDNIINYAREVAPGRWLLIDINQTRYEIYNQNELDANSAKLLKLHLLL
ncbi:MAG: DUF1854 domain-containing protein [Chloroflexi bacterium]|nr:DUF1854 domain-containing protein [Chloroflexota bacterium]